MTTKKNIKDFFALTGNNPPVTDQQLSDVEEWLKSTGIEEPTLDDLVDYLYKTIKQQVVSHTRSKTIIDF